MRFHRGWRSRAPRKMARPVPRQISPGKRKSGRRKLLFFVLLLMFVMTVQSFVFLERNIREPLLSLANMRLKQVATDAINQAITNSISRSDEYYNKLIDWRTDVNGKVSGFMLNYSVHMQVTAEAIEVVTHALQEVSSTQERIPIGQALDSALLASFGPSVPVKLFPIGVVKVDVNTRVQNAGINMILVEVYMNVRTEARIVIPFATSSEVIEAELPISYVLVVGDVPAYYFDGRGNPLGNNASQAPAITLPNVSVPAPSPSS